MSTANSVSRLREQVLRDGYVCIPELFTTEEIERLNEAVKEHFRDHGQRMSFGLTQPDAMSRIPAIRWLLTHEKLLAAFREIAGSDQVQFTFHSDAHSNLIGGWHTETQAYFSPEETRGHAFQVYKVGIYLQDHLGNGQGLTVSAGSHQSEKIEVSKIRPVPTKAGDVIIFDVRILHHGDKMRFVERVCNKLIRSENLKARLGSVMRKVLGRRDKRSIFFTFGAPNDLTSEFARRNMARQNRQNKVDHSQRPQELIELLQAHEVPYVALESR
jgi:ectoine hydroxylase-related dioxygenase (phytanoyl-CoA dioxygenase family)